MLKNTKKNKDILIVGVGNILLGDEGIGVHVIKELEKLNLPNRVELLDIGIAIFSLILHISGRKKVIIVDAVKTSDGDVGKIYRLSVEDIKKDKNKFFSLHQIGIGNILTLSQLNSKPKELVIIGIGIREIKLGTELSPCLKEKMPKIINLILRETPPYFLNFP